MRAKQKEKMKRCHKMDSSRWRTSGGSWSVVTRKCLEREESLENWVFGLRDQGGEHSALTPAASSYEANGKGH